MSNITYGTIVEAPYSFLRKLIWHFKFNVYNNLTYMNSIVSAIRELA